MKNLSMMGTKGFLTANGGGALNLDNGRLSRTCKIEGP